MDTRPENLFLNFTPFPVIETERLLLRKIRESDTPEIRFLRSDGKVMQFIEKTRTETDEQALDWIRMIHRGLEQNEAITWGMTMKGDDRLIGTLGYWNIRREHSRAEIGYNLHTDYWGKGLMTEAIGVTLRYAFGVMRLHSIDANVNPANLASVAVLVKNGFVREGLFRENFYFNGIFYDSSIYSLVNPDATK